jgi:heptosyltransferase-3
LQRRPGLQHTEEVPKAIQRVLIYRLGSLGDHVVALPCLHLIARSFPDAERRLLTNVPVSVKASAAAGIVGNSGLIHGFFRYQVGLRALVPILRLWWQLLLWRPQVLVYLTAARGVAIARRDRRFFRLCGIRRMIGVPDSEDLQANRPLADGWRFEPESSRLARTLAALGDARLEASESWSLHLTEAETARAAEALAPAGGRPILAVSLGTKKQCNEWGSERWSELLQFVGAILPGYALLVNGAANERPASETVADGWRRTNDGPVLNLCGQLTPRESAAAFAQAEVYIGHDSGPMHLAAAAGTPCVAIFAAHEKPGIWFPHGSRHKVIYHQVDCWGCHLETCIVQQKKCITSISVAEVAGKVMEVLAENSPPDACQPVLQPSRRR